MASEFLVSGARTGFKSLWHFSYDAGNVTLLDSLDTGASTAALTADDLGRIVVADAASPGTMHRTAAWNSLTWDTTWPNPTLGTNKYANRLACDAKTGRLVVTHQQTANPAHSLTCLNDDGAAAWTSDGPLSGYDGYGLAAGPYAAGYCIASWPVSKVYRVGLLSIGSPAEIDSVRECLLSLHDPLDNLICARTFTGDDPFPTDGYAELGPDLNWAVEAGKPITLSVTRHWRVSLPDFHVILVFTFEGKPKEFHIGSCRILATAADADAAGYTPL